MKLSRTTLFLLPLIATMGLAPALEVNTIPHPQSVVEQAGEASFRKMKVESTSPELKKEMELLKQELLTRTTSAPKAKEKSGLITLSVDKNACPQPESYSLTITPESISLKGHDRAGVFYGIQTLLQQLKKNKETGMLSLECGVISDAPRFEWRGFMLDESRHFFGKEKVKQLLNNMAHFKMNKLHWHLTDEPGWRIEIKKYPKLTEIGAQRNWTNPRTEKPEFYTQEDIKEIVAYAADRHIEIIPEIDMPGHATAACLAYPELSGGSTKDHPHFTFNPGKEEVYTFLTNVLQEVAPLFPSKYFHIGGDEVSFAISTWEKDPAVMELMKKEGMKSHKEAEAYFYHRMAKVVNGLNKKIMGWDELLNLKPTKDTTILWWRHDRVNALKQSLSEGHETIMCPRRPLYFDFIQHKDHKWGRTWGGFCPSEDVYNFPDAGFSSWNLTPEQMKQIKGIQACQWTERISTPERLDFMIYPRLCALAESAWTQPDKKNLDDFTRRMEPAFEMFDEQKIYYFDTRNPSKHKEPKGAEKVSGDKVPLDFRD